VLVLHLFAVAVGRVSMRGEFLIFFFFFPYFPLLLTLPQPSAARHCFVALTYLFCPAYYFPLPAICLVSLSSARAEYAMFLRVPVWLCCSCVVVASVASVPRCKLLLGPTQSLLRLYSHCAEALTQATQGLRCVYAAYAAATQSIRRAA
jgi:hypothetical protein